MRAIRWALVVCLILTAAGLASLFFVRFDEATGLSGGGDDDVVVGTRGAAPDRTPRSEWSAPVRPGVARTGSPATVAEAVTAQPTTEMGASAPVEAKGLMEEYRRESNAILRREALRKWADEKRPGLRPVLEVALTDSDPSVIIQALALLEVQGSHGLVERLAAVLKDNVARPDGYGLPIREAAVKALGSSGEESAVPILINELEKHEDLSYDNEVVQALGQVGRRSALEAMDGQRRYLDRFNPTESIARESLNRAKAITEAARDQVAKRIGGI